MARGIHQLILLAVCAGAALPVAAEPASKPEKKHRKAFAGTPSPEFENVRKALDALTPDQRKRFQENFWRWANLPPEEKKALRDREDTRKKLMEQEVRAAIDEIGLQLDGESHALFVRRYGQERKRVEEQLRKESMEKRKPMVKDILARLKAEFSEGALAPSNPATTPDVPTNR